MGLILQIWGGGFSLFNKVFFALAEGKEKNTQRWLKIIGLMWIQDKPILAVQQVVSLCFVTYGFTVSIKINHKTRETSNLRILTWSPKYCYFVR
jgi:hypothetical protein